MRLEIVQNCPRSPTRLATIAQVRQAAGRAQAPIGLMLGGVDFRHLYINLGSVAYESLEAAEKAGAPLIKYGAFINNAVDFLIIAFALFVAIKAINKFKRAQPPASPAPAAPPEDVLLLREIRDALKK